MPSPRNKIWITFWLSVLAVISAVILAYAA